VGVIVAVNPHVNANVNRHVNAPTDQHWASRPQKAA
jgi:hypothetical protein